VVRPGPVRFGEAEHQIANLVLDSRQAVVDGVLDGIRQANSRTTGHQADERHQILGREQHRRTTGHQTDDQRQPTDLAVGGSSPSRRAIPAGQSRFELPGIGVCLPRLTDLLPVHTAGVNSYEEQRYRRQRSCAPRMAVVSHPDRGGRTGRQASGVDQVGIGELGHAGEV
jgi:hypothetical protein